MRLSLCAFSLSAVSCIRGIKPVDANTCAIW